MLLLLIINRKSLVIDLICNSNSNNHTWTSYPMLINHQSLKIDLSQTIIVIDLLILIILDKLLEMLSRNLKMKFHSKSSTLISTKLLIKMMVMMNIKEKDYWVVNQAILIRLLIKDKIKQIELFSKLSENNKAKNKRCLLHSKKSILGYLLK